MVSLEKKKGPRNFIEIGRIVFITFGPSNGKIGLIVDILDKNRCMIDGPPGRQVINLKRIKPTQIKLKIGRSLNSKSVHLALKTQDIIEKWEKSLWCKKKKTVQKKQSFSDYSKFKFMLGKKASHRILKAF
ncbi:rpl14 (nucleomorph) [Hemiselmis andersenii]|uniref:Rpl14 n=1 Tax=Hemiselmis andersenii TaxID=464988 RepID=A9BKI9_HEMAN|nr:rpl14 [Hemiselmis andersenii]ABW98160.1 rpl14 [Hemiselmis andersenii]|mmetsp:Transcript_39956/g.93573  ORF Transcript_39956/g.93573 Transcript_39956/m.93573 type:complete len:131 (-) Transcript_39956:142-534(-)